MRKKKSKKKKNKLVLSKPQKIASAQALRQLGFSIRQISEILEIDKNTAMRYFKQELDEEFVQFSEAIKKIYLEQDFELTQLAVKHIKKKINQARFYELVGLLKVIRELNIPHTQNAIQVNIQPLLGGISRSVKERRKDEKQK